MKHGFNGDDHDKDLTRELEEVLRKSMFGMADTEKELLFEAAVAMKKLYDSFIEADFTEKQSIMLVAQIVTGKTEE